MIIEHLFPMLSLRILRLSVFRPLPGPGAPPLFPADTELFETIEKLRFETPCVPQFVIMEGPSYDQKVFQWEFEGEGRREGRFKRLRKLSLD